MSHVSCVFSERGCLRIHDSTVRFVYGLRCLGTGSPLRKHSAKWPAPNRRKWVRFKLALTDAVIQSRFVSGFITQAYPSARRVKVFSRCPTRGAGKREARLWIYRDPVPTENPALDFQRNVAL